MLPLEGWGPAAKSAISNTCQAPPSKHIKSVSEGPERFCFHPSCSRGRCSEPSVRPIYRLGFCFMGGGFN